MSHADDEIQGQTSFVQRRRLILLLTDKKGLNQSFSLFQSFLSYFDNHSLHFSDFSMRKKYGEVGELSI